MCRKAVTKVVSLVKMARIPSAYNRLNWPHTELRYLEHNLWTVTALSKLHRFIGWSQNDYQRHFSNCTTQMFENVTFSFENNNYWHILVLFLLGVAVVNTDSKEHIQSNFTVIMTNGIGFQVAELQRSNVLQLDVMMPGNTFVSNFSGVPLTCWIKLPCPFLIVSQSDCLI